MRNPGDPRTRRWARGGRLQVMCGEDKARLRPTISRQHQASLEHQNGPSYWIAENVISY